MFLHDPITDLKGIGKKKAALYRKLNIRYIDDLLQHYPRHYIDRTRITPLMACKDQEQATVKVVIESVQMPAGYRNHKSPMKLLVRDDSGEGEVVFFNAKFLKNMFAEGDTFYFYGSVKREYGRITFMHPEFNRDSKKNRNPFLGIVPVYGLTEGLIQKEVRITVKRGLDSVGPRIHENLPLSTIENFKLMTRVEALHNIHYPTDEAALEQAQERLVFEELFALQLGLVLIKQDIKLSAKKHQYNGREKLMEVVDQLPFTLTGDQQKVLDEILDDLESPRVMNRLVQGDVGSGKTVLALLAMYHAYQNHLQSALMVPTEILAEQHFVYFKEELQKYGVNVALLTSKTKDKQRILASMDNGEIDVVIGTHSLIQEQVTFKKLGLVITDEQHRFGVRQRGSLTLKGDQPDVMIMSATPIPRTLSLILYGDVDVSIIREMPKGRKPIKTHYIKTGKRSDMYQFIKDAMDQGRQAYIVCPLIEESEKLELKSAVELFDELRNKTFKQYQLGLIHGRMKNDEKEAVMRTFVEGELQMLIATTVIEVGINVPNATIMVIEDSERFGLAQLHQLRGRVGRGHEQSYCFLMSKKLGKIAKERIKILVQSNDGFEIANRDLEIRGPGEVLGTRQHGLPELKIANLLDHMDALAQAQEEVKRLVEPEGNQTENEKRFIEKFHENLVL